MTRTVARRADRVDPVWRPGHAANMRLSWQGRQSPEVNQAVRLSVRRMQQKCDSDPPS